MGRWLSIVWLLPALALAEGLVLEDGLPVGEKLTWLELTAPQRAQAAAALAGDGWVELELTASQQQALARATGVRGTWVSAGSAEVLGDDCTCGAQNLAVLQPRRIAVLHSFFSTALTFTRAQRAAGALRDPALAAARRTDGKYAAGYARFDASGEQAPWLVALHATPPAAPLQRFSERIPLPSGWRAAKVRLATGGLIGPGELLADDVLKTLPWSESDLRAEPADAAAARWAERGAVRRAGDLAEYLVPVVADQESEGYRRAWLLLRYRAGLLRTLSLVAEGGQPASVLSLGWDAASAAPVLEAAAWGLPTP